MDFLLGLVSTVFLFLIQVVAVIGQVIIILTVFAVLIYILFFKKD